MKILATTKHIKINYRFGGLERAELVHEEGGYQLYVHGDDEQLLVARRDGNAARTWTSVDRALAFMKKQFGFIREIKLIYPPEGDSK